MLKILKYNWFWYIFASSIVLFTFTIFSNWVILSCVWFGVFFLFRFSQLESKLSNKEHRLYLLTIFIYPLIETLITWLIKKNIIPYSWHWLNRLEHFGTSVALVIILLPVFTGVWTSLKWWQTLAFIIGLVCLVGNINEFFEYSLRACCKPYSDVKYAVYYWDTIYDMVMNIAGGLVGFIIIRWNHKSI